MNIKKTTDVLTEKPIVVRFGLLFFVIRPMTMAQIYEIGAIVEKTEGIDLDGDFNPIVKMLESYKDVKHCSDVIVTMIFRSRIMRKLLGWYIKKHLTMERYRKIIEFGALSFQAAFFLTSFTFLKGTKEVTKPTNTAKATVHGDLLEE